jgi:hypothetical protein
MEDDPPFPAPPGFHWICQYEIRHWRSKQMMRRKDGKPFRILCRNKR